MIDFTMFNYSFVILCFALLSANESYGWFFCPADVLESLIRCLLKTDIVDGLLLEMFNRRLECARQAKCHPKLFGTWDRKIWLVHKFFVCMEEIHSSSIFYELQGIDLEMGLHMLEKQCRENLAENLPQDLKYYYLPLLGRKR